jgi:hypothetical protein
MTDEVKKDEATSTALAVRTANELNNALVAQSGKAHILTPFTQTVFDEDIYSSGLRPSLRFVHIDANPEDAGPKEVYKNHERQGEVCLSKRGLDKLAQVAGIEWLRVVRLDDGKDPLRAHYLAEGRMRLIDGTWHSVTKTKDCNLNDGSPEMLAMRDKPAQLARARKNIAAVTESKAQNRVMRVLLGVKDSYRPEELKKPFLAMKIIPDMSNPEVRRMVQAQMLGLEKYLFPGNQEEAPALPPADGYEVPSGTKGLEIPDPPGSTGTGPVIDVKPEPEIDEARRKKIERIEELYYMTGLVRDTKKKPVNELPDAELDDLTNALLTKQVIRPPKQKADDLI